MIQLKPITPLMWRVIGFLCLFIIFSGLIGPRIVGSDILSRDGFEIYGGLGKATIFGLIAFVLLTRRDTSHVTLQPWRSSMLGWIGLAVAAFVLAWVSVDGLIAGQRTLQNLMLAHTGLLVSLICAAIGCFGIKNIHNLWVRYRRKIVWSAGIAIAFYLFLQVVYMLWQPLASLVLFIVTGLLDLSGLEVTVIPPHTLLLDKFGVTIAAYCSGIESIALFTSLYVIVGLLDWHRLHKKRYLILFPFALLILWLLNVLRVFVLIIAGYHISPEIAFSLFHTYAGTIFFILYSLVFWSIAYKHLIITKKAHHET